MRANNSEPKKTVRRCRWAVTDLSIAYHDREWGVPVHDERTLFEFLILEGAQAGLSWETILRKRENYRRAFDNFVPAKVARYDQRRVAKLLSDQGIIRNHLKITSAVENAKAFLKIQKEFGSFDAYVWRFVEGKPLQRKRGSAIQATSTVSDTLSQDLKKRGFKFVGSTICYSFMQAVGLVNEYDVLSIHSGCCVFLINRKTTVADSSCLFCKVVSGELAARIVFEDEDCLAFLDHRPVFPGHCLLIPKKHYETLTDLPVNLIQPLFHDVQVLARAVETSLEAHGSFVAMNNRVSQSVPHLHVHVVPRRRKDGLRGFFWPRYPYKSDEEADLVQEAIRTVVKELTR